MMRKRNFIIIKTEDGRYNLALRRYPDHPLDQNGYHTKRATRKRLREYVRKANEYIRGIEK